jgi:hypothetical protein
MHGGDPTVAPRFRLGRQRQAAIAFNRGNKSSKRARIAWNFSPSLAVTVWLIHAVGELTILGVST